MTSAESAMDNPLNVSSATGQKEDNGLAADLWRGMQRGAQDEITYDQEHYLDSAVRGGLAIGGSHFMATEDALLKHNMKIGLVYGAAVSAGHFFYSPGHFDEVTAKAKESSSVTEGVAYTASRFVTDAGITIGLTAGTTRASWSSKGEKAIAEIINNETRSYHQAAFRGTHGHWAPAKTVTEPVFRQERAEQLNRFLTYRGQQERFPGLAVKLEQLPEAKNQKVWTYDLKLNGGPRILPKYDPPPQLDIKQLLLAGQKPA